MKRVSVAVVAPGPFLVGGMCGVADAKTDAKTMRNMTCDGFDGFARIGAVCRTEFSQSPPGAQPQC